MTKLSRTLLIGVAALSLTACGLHLRGHGPNDAKFAFHSIYIQAPAETVFTKVLRRGLIGYKLAVQDAPGKQDLTLNVQFENTDKQITALSGSGHVIEYLLRYRISFRVYDRQLHDWLPDGEIQLQRILPYDDTLVLAKQQEEVMLYDDMRTDAAQQVLRRLAYARPPKAEEGNPLGNPPDNTQAPQGNPPANPQANPQPAPQPGAQPSP